MLLPVLVLSSFISDIQANLVNETYTDQHEIHKRDAKFETGQELCPGLSLEECRKAEPEKLKNCEICGLINGGRHKFMNLKGPRLIVKGKIVKPPYKYPWMVTIMQGTRKTCGGAIVSDEYILTAGHCVTEFGENGEFIRFFRPSDLTIGFLTKTNEVKPGPPTQKIIRHPGYDPDEMNYDVALLKLKRKITCCMFRNPICLPDIADVHLKTSHLNTGYLITGWGAVSGLSLQYPTKLQEGRVRMVPFSQCSVYSHVKKSGYCLNGIRRQRPCFGDSGGSLYFRHKNKYHTLGVASMHTNAQCKANKPFVYAAIPKALPWIKRVIGSSHEQEVKSNKFGKSHIDIAEIVKNRA